MPNHKSIFDRVVAKLAQNQKAQRELEKKTAELLADFDKTEKKIQELLNDPTFNREALSDIDIDQPLPDLRKTFVAREKHSHDAQKSAFWESKFQDVGPRPWVKDLGEVPRNNKS